MAERIVILGTGGHAKVVQEAGKIPVRMTDCDDVEDGEILVLGMGDMDTRRRLADKWPRERFICLVDDRAIVSPSADYGYGTQILAGAIIQTNAVLGDFVLVNTGAQIDHDCHIGNHVFLAPGVVLGGNVTIEDGVFVGMNATILPGLKVGKGAIIGAGALVTKDVGEKKLVKGVW